MAKDDGVAAAKAKLIEVAGEIDLLAPVRQHPLVSVAIAGASGAAMGASTEQLASAAALTHSVTALLRAAITAVQHAQASAAQSNTSPTPKSQPDA